VGKKSKQEKETIGEYVDIDSLIQWDLNPRNNSATVNKVANSIQRFGFASPIIVRKEDNTIIAGHTRYLASKQLGLSVVPVRYMDLSPTDAQLLAIADNKIQESSTWDDDKLREIISELSQDDLQHTGFSSDELDLLINENTNYSDDFVIDDDESPHGVVNPQGRAGEIVQIVLWYNEDENNLFRDYIQKVSSVIEGTNSEIILELLKNEYYKITEEESE
tara:strand:- start:3720 stop:4379 length:660 start_codon:yes stop_codon:yes gene_type:complete